MITQSIRHNWRTHLGVILGVALAMLVFTGALMVGDSVKGTLRAQAEARVGKIGEALLCGERFVPWPADKKKRPTVVARMFFPGVDSAGVLLMHGSAVSGDGKARANKVQVVGVDADFWKLSPSSDVIDRIDDVDAVNTVNGVNPVRVTLNQRIATQLSLKVGDALSLYLEKPSAFSKDAPLSGEEAALVTVKARVGRIVGDEDFGRFALTASQVPPNTVFVPLGELQGKVGLGEKVNVVVDLPTPSIITNSEKSQLRLISILSKLQNRKEQTSVSEIAPSGFIRGSDDIRGTFGEEFVIKGLENKQGIELRTSRVFLDAAITAAARESEKSNDKAVDIFRPLSASDAEVATGSSGLDIFPIHPTPPLPGLDSLTYFVTSIEKGTPLADGKGALTKVADYFRATPYSMITAIDAPASGFVQAELANDEIQISRWLADDLEAKPGDKLTLRYNIMGERRELVEKTRTFTILAPIIEMSEPQLDSSWMPDFPNVPDKDSFAKWKPGFPFDSKRIRKKDEEYWEQHRGTPKAFVNLKVGQEMWGNRWGNLTSIRYPAGTKREQVERIAAFIDPKALGFRVVNLRDQALAATDAPVDFGELFASFSFFLIAAAAVLTGLLFTFTIEQRAAEAGLLLAVGWTRKQVRRLFLKEGTLLAIIGALLGVGGAALYTKAVLHALGGVWSGATGGTKFLFVVKGGTLAVGIIGSVLIAFFAMWLASRRLFKNEAAALMSGSFLETEPAKPTSA